jgi:L-asparagine oxygenase
MQNHNYPSTCTIIISEEENNKLIDLGYKIIANPTEDPELFCEQSKIYSKQIPERIQEILINFSKNGNDYGFLLIKNVASKHNQTLPKTPDNNNSKIGETTLLACIQSMFIHLIGEMIAYEAEGYGRLFQDVVPVKKMENEQTSVGSNTELEIHTEQAFSKLRPDILSLACIRGDNQAQTYILPVQYILEDMDEKEREILKQPLWKTGVDLSFKLNNNEFIEGDIRGPLPIISGNIDDPKLTFDQDLMFGTNEESEKLIQKIIETYYKKRIQHNLQTGEIILIDNMRAVHGRSPFYPKYDGNDRFLIRCFGVYNYEYSSYARKDGGRMVSAIYS